MALRIETGWTIADAGAHTLDVTDGGGNAQISLPSAAYCHTDISSVAQGGYADAASAWQTALNASGTLAGTYIVSWSSSSLRYTITSSSGFALAYSGDAVLRGMHSLGFASAQTTAGVHVGDNTPHYVMAGEMGAASNWSGEYEPDDVVEESVADDGTPFSLGKPSTLNYLDFELRMEQLANVFIDEKASAALWSWEDFFRHARSKEPLLFDDGLKSRVLLLRRGGARFRPTPAFPDFNGLWHLPFATRQLGTL